MSVPHSSDLSTGCVETEVVAKCRDCSRYWDRTCWVLRCEWCGEPFLLGFDVCMNPDCWVGERNIADEAGDRLYHGGRGQ
jgi:hypothetical protein